MTPGYVRVVWANVVFGAMFVLLVTPTIELIVQDAESIADQTTRAAVTASGIVFAVGVLATLVVRSARLGVRARPDGLQIRNLLRTRILPWTAIIGTTTERRIGAKGHIYYAPTLDVRGRAAPVDRHALVVLPPDQRPDVLRSISLFYLASTSEEAAQRRTGRIQSMIESAASAA